MMKRQKVKAQLFTYSVLTLATLIMVIGIYIFKFPNNYSFGGVSGISIVLSAIIPLSAGTINFILNMVLLALGFLFLGKSFGVMTVYVSILSSLGLSFLEKVFPMQQPLTNEPVLDMMIQFDTQEADCLFTDYNQVEEKKRDEEREKKMQEAVLKIQDRFGKNAILKGTNLCEGATTIERNNQIGGHRA